MESSGPLCEICGGDTDIKGVRCAKLGDDNRSRYFCAECVKPGETAVPKSVCAHCHQETEIKRVYVVVPKHKPAPDQYCVSCGKTLKNESSFKCIQRLSGAVEYECSQCMTHTGAVPDVWYGYGSGEHTEENIAYPKGHPKEGQPIPFHDKQSKRAAMREAGVREAGDRIHGARNEDMVPKNRKKYFC